MAKKKKSFRDAWSNQTKLGHLFGISSVRVGKILVQHGLKCGAAATQKALDDGYAIATPLKDGTPFFMWNVEKVKPLLAENNKELTAFEMYVADIKGMLHQAQKIVDAGEDKMASLMFDMAFDDVPDVMHDAVKAKVYADLGWDLT